ncbi:uncharacterized protein ZBAI_00032 [Zygosaccharomyces bailii ISA1307]|nr:uncharacterized protein ZBAI_00032 [Zygosaccharomyces bailii ISA1307]
MLYCPGNSAKLPKNLSGTRIEPVSPPWKGGMITTTLTALRTQVINVLMLTVTRNNNQLPCVVNRRLMNVGKPISKAYEDSANNAKCVCFERRRLNKWPVLWVYLRSFYRSPTAWTFYV